MGRNCRIVAGLQASALQGIGLPGIGLLAVGLLALLPLEASAQLRSSTQYELSPSIQIEDVDETDARSHLARIQAYLADKKWDEAVEALRKVAENFAQRVIQVDDDERRYQSVREYCDRQIAALPPEALALYRARVDPVAAVWYKQGVAERDERRLGNVVEQMFCSSYGDAALLALGEIALERGEYDTARTDWERISPLLRAADGRQVWQALSVADLDKQLDRIAPQFVRRAGPPQWLAYPDTHLDLAAVRARLVLVSIMEGSLPRARLELNLLAKLHPRAAGRLAGHTGPYAATLAALLDEAGQWPAPPNRDGWTTFAGAATRNKSISERPGFAGRPAWELAFVKPAPVSDEPARYPALRSPLRSPLPVGGGEHLDYHPLLVDNLVLFCNEQQVFAFDARSGKPAWPKRDATPGQIYPSGGATPATRVRDPESIFGEPRYTLTADGDYLFARLGSPVTGRQAESPVKDESNSLVCLNWRKPQFEWVYPNGHEVDEYDEGRWACEGSPVCDGQRVYVAMRRSLFRSEEHVAALDVRDGRLIWRRHICSADTPTHGMRNETTHNLLTLHEGTLYCNTNLGAVAALSTADGAIRWVYRYERAAAGDLETGPAHCFRDLNPCVYYRGLVFTAPSDSPTLFALDAATGEPAWKPVTTLRLDPQPIHLLGVGSGNLIATGKCVWWINAATGIVHARWPEPGLDGEAGYGRGLLAGGCIYWPTREQIIVLDQQAGGGQAGGGQSGVRIVDRIQLQRPDTNNRVGGGNLAFAGGTLLVAGENRLFGFATWPQSPNSSALTVAPRPGAER